MATHTKSAIPRQIRKRVAAISEQLTQELPHLDPEKYFAALGLKVPRNLRQIPMCVAAISEQLARELPRLDHDTLYRPILNTGFFGGSIVVVPSNKSILLFLCCRDKQREHREGAYALWNEVRKLKGEGTAYELEASDLVYEAAWYVVDYRGLTRDQLRTLDDNLARAARNLIDALRDHADDSNDFKNESSAANWPEEYMTGIARMLRGVPYPNDRFLAAGEDPSCPPSPFDKIDWPIPRREDRLFWLLCHAVPRMTRMLEVLERRAQELSSSRLNARKRHAASGDPSDARFIRRLVAGVVSRNPTAPADQVARIVSPIVDRVVGGETTLARCKKVAQRIKHELEIDGTISPS
jgi:hypothetical protein